MTRHLTKLFCLLTFLVLTTISQGQSPFHRFEQRFSKEYDSLHVHDLFDFYTAQWGHMDSIEIYAKAISCQLQNINSNAAVMNEVARVKAISFKGDIFKSYHILDSLKQLDLVSNSSYLMGYIHSSEGNLHYSLSFAVEARNSYKASLIEFRKCKANEEIKNNLINMGNSYSGIGIIDSSLMYYDSAQVLENLGVLNNSNALKSNYAMAYRSGGQPEKALVLLKELLSPDNNLNLYGRVIALNNISESYLMLDSSEMAMKYLKEAQSLIKTNELQGFTHVNETVIAAAFAQLKQYDSAYYYSNLALNHKVAQNDKDITRQIDGVKMKHQHEQQLKERQFNELKIKSQRNKMTFLWILLFIAFAVLVIILILNKRLGAANQELTRKNLELIRSPEPSAKQPSSRESFDNDLLTLLSNEMTKENVYSDEGLNLEKLAKMLKTNRSYLSEAINKGLNTNFNGYLNSVRINAARELLVDSNFDHFSIEGIAKHVGYRSLSSFNVAFKKQTGLTPSYFRKSAKSVLSTSN